MSFLITLHIYIYIITIHIYVNFHVVFSLPSWKIPGSVGIGQASGKGFVTICCRVNMHTWVYIYNIRLVYLSASRTVWLLLQRELLICRLLRIATMLTAVWVSDWVDWCNLRAVWHCSRRANLQMLTVRHFGTAPFYPVAVHQPVCWVTGWRSVLPTSCLSVCPSCPPSCLSVCLS